MRPKEAVRVGSGAQDIHGKSYSNAMLAIELPDPA
jgi:hypothetical protein